VLAIADLPGYAEEGEMLDPETPPAAKTNRPKETIFGTFLDSMRDSPQFPPASTLTSHNLNSHNMQVPPVQRPRATVETASAHMKKVYEDKASSLSTSVMSGSTRQQSDWDCLGEHTMIGKADAVRKLLRAGCNPGTKKEPRLGPIFNVVRGASARHTKCLRALIQHGVDVNVRSKKTKKTPLLEAFEQDD
jgi:hypothetical protein